MRSFSWVIDGRLGGMAYPGLSYPGYGIEGLARDLGFLREQGVRSIVSLTDPPLDRDALRSAGLDCLHLPIPDMASPTGEEVDRFVAFVSTCLESDKPTAVHCAVGMGRTGTLLACYLVKEGLSGMEAIQEVRRRRPGSIETSDQQAAVLQYDDRLGRDGGERSVPRNGRYGGDA